MLTAVSYIKPTHDFETFKKCFEPTKDLPIDNFIINFKDKLKDNYKTYLTSQSRLIWKDDVNEFWIKKILQILDAKCAKYQNKTLATYIFLWEEDTYIYDSKEFIKTFNLMKDLDIDFMGISDKKWIEREKFLYKNNLAYYLNNCYISNWGSKYAQYCRENSSNPLIKGAYPITLPGIFNIKFLYKILKRVLDSMYWKRITSGVYESIHENPITPHSLEVCPIWWWNKKEYNPIEYSMIVSKNQFGYGIGGAGRFKGV